MVSCLHHLFLYSYLKNSHKINECSSRLDIARGITMLFMSLMPMLPSVVFCLKVGLAEHTLCEEQGGDGVGVNCRENSNLC